MTVTDETKVKNDPIDPVVQEILDRHWDFKQVRVKNDFESYPGDGGPVGGDMAPMLAFSTEDGSGLRLEFLCQRINKHDALAAAKLITPMIKSDWLLATLDAHIAHDMINPATGERWKPGEMQKACDEDGACSTGIVTDAITSMLVRRDGSTQMISRTYHVDKLKGEIHWIDISSMDTKTSGNSVSGLVAEGFIEAIQHADGFMGEKEVQLASEAGIEDRDRPTFMLITAAQLSTCVIGGGAAPIFRADEIARNEDHIRESLTEEAVLRMREKMGPLPLLLRMKWGLDS